MKSIILAGALAAPLCLSPAMADDEGPTSFHALTALSAGGHGTVTVMTEQELAAVKGQAVKQKFKCKGACFNLAIVTQKAGPTGVNTSQINQALGNFNRTELENEID